MCVLGRPLTLAAERLVVSVQCRNHSSSASRCTQVCQATSHVVVARSESVCAHATGWTCVLPVHPALRMLPWLAIRRIKALGDHGADAVMISFPPGVELHTNYHVVSVHACMLC